jgi:hypothetical protein
MVKWKEDQFRQIKDSELSRRLNELSNVWLSTFFGNQVSEDDYYKLQNHLSPEKYPDWAGLREREWFTRTQALAGAKRFFHWELEFPEAFQGEGRGFDVVIGNPPYVRQEALGEFKDYFKQKYQVFHGVADLYVYFIELGLSLLRKEGQFSYILANKWLRASYGEPLRRWMKAQRIEEIVDFGDLPVFPEATTYPCILRLSANHPASNFQMMEVETLDFKSLEEYVKKHRFSVSVPDLEDSSWSLVNDSARKLLEKLRRSGVSLSEFVNGKIFYGIKTGLNEAFIIDNIIRNKLISEDPNSAELIKPFLAGRDIKRYEPLETDQYFIFTRRGIDIERYPAIKIYLSKFKERLMPKPKDWNGEYWLGRKPGTYEWYEIQDAIDYYEEFEKPKIFWPEIAGNARFTFDSSKFYANNKTGSSLFSVGSRINLYSNSY